MDVLFILIAIPLVFITLVIVIGTSIRFVKSFNHVYEPMANSKLAQFNHKISPVIISFIAACPRRLCSIYIFQQMIATA